MQPTLEVGLSGLGLSPLRLRPLLPPAAPSAEEEQRDKALEFGEGGAEPRLLVGGRYIGSRRRRLLNLGLCSPSP